MRSKVVEITSSCNIGLKAPREILLRGIVKFARRARETNLHIHYLAYLARLNYVHHLDEIRKITPVISHETRNARLLAHSVDAGAVVITCSQRFLHIKTLSHMWRGSMEVSLYIWH